jgi:hypothetical protein
MKKRKEEEVEAFVDDLFEDKLDTDYWVHSKDNDSNVNA